MLHMPLQLLRVLLLICCERRPRYVVRIPPARVLYCHR